MYHHVKQLMYTVRVDTPDPRFGNMLLEQFGRENGELAAAMQYSVQGINCEDPERKDLLMDIGTEELSHLEIIGVLTRMHLNPLKSKRQAAPRGALKGSFQIVGRKSAAQALQGDDGLMKKARKQSKRARTNSRLPATWP